MSLNTRSSSPGELEMTRSTSAVAVCCSRASFSSRVRAATCSWRSAADAFAVGALQALGLTARRPFTGCPLPPRRCIAPPAGHDDAQSYANPCIRAMVMSALGRKQTFRSAIGMSALPRKRSALGDSRIFLDAFVIGDQPEGKAKDHSDVVYNQNDNPAVRGTRPEFS